MQREQRRDLTVRQRAVSLANLLVALRSAAHLYPTRQDRRERVQRWLFDVRFFETAREYTPRLELPQQVFNAFLDFCLGHVGAHVLGERLLEAFSNTDRGRRFLQTRQLFDSLVASVATTRQGHVTTDEAVSAGASGGDVVRDRDDRDPSDLRKYGTFWYALYGRLRTLTVTTVPNAVPGQVGEEDDNYDARIEFGRQVTLDTRHGMAGVTAVPSANGFVAFDECYTTLASVGHLYRSTGSVSSPTGAATNTVFLAEYPVYVFGSNCFWIESDAVYTLRSSVNRPPAFENKEQIVLFARHLMSIVDTDLVPDVLECRRLAAAKNRPVITSVSRNEVSLQFSFAMPDSLMYTADLFYLSGSNTCATNLHYKRQCLSNVCKCENRLSYWRVCVSVAAFDGSRLSSPFGHNGMSRFATDAVRAFYLAKSAEKGDHFYINAFTGLALVHYTDDSIALGGMVEDDYNTASPGESTTAATCYMHSWLRGHMNERYWRPVAVHHATDLLNNTPQLLVVCRPLISESVTAADGPNVFLKYKTFEDVLVKYVLLTSIALSRGYADSAKGIAYKTRDCFWLFSDVENSDDGERVDGNPAWLQEVDSFGSGTSGVPSFDMRRDTNDIFRHVFSAPSRLYVHADVLAGIGFNVTAVNVATPARTFTHTASEASENRCTVFCSSPLVVIDETTGAPLERSIHEVEVLRVLTRDQAQAVATSANPLFVKTTITCLDGFWPGVNAVKTTFSDPVLLNVELVYFTAPDGDGAVQRLTTDGLARLSEVIANERDGFEPMSLPVLFALQHICVHLKVASAARD